MILHTTDKDIELLVNDNSYSYEAIMGEDTLTLYFSHPGFINIPVGAWCEFYGKRYSLKKDSNFKKNGERNYEYTLVLETSKADTQLWKVRNVVDNRIKFSYTAKPKEHLQLLVDNLNRRSSYKWKVGECIEGIEKTINYNHTYVLDGINQVATAYETEWQFIEEVKEEVHDGVTVKVPEVSICLRKVEYNKDNPLKLSYGKGHGFKTGVGREAGEVLPEIILVETTDRNIDYLTYGAKELLMPKSGTIRFDGGHFEDEAGFNASAARSYKTDETGTCVMRADKAFTTAKEDSLDCTGIFPSRVGTISEVIPVDVENHFYDFVDKEIPETLDFEKCLIAGENMTVIFQSGMLVGREFEVKYNHASKDSKKARRFELVPQEIDGITMPGGDVWVPKVGDKYAVFGIQLPEAYLCDNATKTGASWDVFRQAAKYLYEHEGKEFTFTGTLDGIWAKKRWLDVGRKIVLGGFVNFSDTQFHPEGSLIRMTGIKRYVNNPYSPEIELSNAPVGTSISSDLNKIETNEVVVDDKHKEALQFTKRRFRDARETMDMLAASLLNYSGSVNPITVATMQMLVGDESLQFRFVNSKTNPVAVSHNISYNACAKVLNAPVGILQHMTLGIKELSSTYAGKYKFWDMAEYNSPSLVEPEKKFYLYAKCSKADQSGTFFLSETAIGMEQIEGYYHFLVGVLNSENAGERSYASLYGFTEVLPGRITTDKIISSEGTSYFDMVNNAMKLGSILDFNSRGDGKLRLRGTLIQSPSGDESALGAFRGSYSSYSMYYSGDEVTYNGSMYHCIQNCPTAGIMPINTTYWQLVAQKGTDGGKGDKGNDGLPGEMAPTGKMLYRNPDFSEGLNSINVYNNYGNGNVAVERIERISDCPNNSTHCIQISNKGEATPGLGGFYFGNMSRANAKFITRIIAKIPIGYNIEWASNAIGEEGFHKWITPQHGTGKFEEYICIVQCGITGAFSSTNFFYLYAGANGTLAEPVVWYLAYATVFDATQAEVDYLKEIENSIDIQPAYNYRGNYSPNVGYIGSNQRVDVVKYNNVYYRAKRKLNGSFSNQTPADNSTYWENFGAQFESIATNLLLAENANVGGWVFRNNRLESENGSVYLDGIKGKARLAGTVQYSTGYSGNISDVNMFFLPARTTSKDLTMGYEKEDIGKVCRLYNNSAIGTKGIYYINLCTFGIGENVTDATFGTVRAILKPQEVLEVSCFELPPNSLGSYPICAKWTITSRFSVDNWINQPSDDTPMGRFPRMLAMGHLYATNNSASVSGYFFDGRSLGTVFKASRIGEGHYRLSFSSGLLGDGYMVMAVGSGTIYGGSNPVYASIQSRTKSYFDVYIGDDSSRNDGSFDFLVFSPYWYYPMQNV